MTTLLPGTEVQARGLRWEIVTADHLGAQTRYRLRCLDAALRGDELDVLTPFEPVIPLVRDLRPDRAAPLRNWLVYHQAFLLEQAVGPHALLAVQPGRLRIEPYQLVPVLRAIQMSRIRLLLADGVGLGKTIQAGLVLTELLARRIAHRILIVAPAGPLLLQWQMELRERFGLRMEIIDRARLEEIRRSTELGANPFDHLSQGLASMDFLKQERMLDQLERTSYDVVIIDEAHHCMDLGSTQERDDSQRRRLADVLARRCDALLLLTATPHDGSDRSFASLCELLDPSLVNGTGELRGERYRSSVVRRLKQHIRDPATGAPRFPPRIVLPQPVVPSPESHAAFLTLQQGLLGLIAPELTRAFRARRYHDVLAYLALLKRSVSTVAACRSTLTVVAERFARILHADVETQESRRQRRSTLRDYQRNLERFGTVSVEEEADRHLLEVEDLAQQLALLQRDIRSGSRAVKQVADVVDTLEDLLLQAETALAHDPKLEHLVAMIQAIRTEEPGANVLVYTEYTDSQEAVVHALRTAQVGPVLTMRGDDSDRVRSDVTERFRTEADLVLVSTDAAAEGLNLQQRCHHLIHLELPFNPNRLEQRNGRIDRFGQTHAPQVRYLFLRGTFEERILLRLVAKYERQRARLTFVPNTLGLTAASEVTAARLLQGLLAEDRRLGPEPDAPLTFDELADDPGDDAATHELLQEVDRSLQRFARATQTHAWLGDAGLQADVQVVQAADQARQQGSQVSTVDLATFVGDAILLDGGDVRGTIGDAPFELQLPAAWTHGLTDLPGYDAEQRRIRLTTDLERTRDEQQRPVGYLGRAHPLVRRALDRVRNLSFGGAADAGQDVRTSVVAAAVPTPTLLVTYLGTVSSTSGRALERVLAVAVPGVWEQASGALQPGPATWHPTPDTWLPLADPTRAIRTTGVFERHFQPWFAGALEQAETLARQQFAPLAAAFTRERQADLDTERRQQEAWLRQRAQELLGTPTTATVQQMGLFDDLTTEPGSEPAARPEWMDPNLDDPVTQLAAFALDLTRPPRLRSEADGVVRIYRRRVAALEDQRALYEPEVFLLGVLMLIPETTHAA